MEFSGMNKTTEETFSFPSAVSHPAHIYNSLHCSPNSEFGEKSISDASPDEHPVLRLVDDFSCAYTNNLRDCASFKSPNSRSTSLDASLSASGDVAFEDDSSKLTNKTIIAHKVTNDIQGAHPHDNGVESTDVKNIYADVEMLSTEGFHRNFVNVSTCNGTASRPNSNSTISSPVSKSEAVNDINGLGKPSVPSPLPETDRTKMDLDKLDETIDYVLALARSDDPCEGMFVLSCRMREPLQMSSPNLRSNTPSSCLIASPTLSPAPSPHSSQINTSPLVAQPPKSQSVFSNNNLCNVISAQPMQRYIVDQTHGILHLSSNSTAQYSNQTVSFVQLCPDSSSSPVIQATQQLVSQIAQPPTSAHVVFHPSVLHTIQNPTAHQTQFTVPHSNISAVSVQRIQNSILSPVKNNLPNAPHQVQKLSDATPSQSVQNRSDSQQKISNGVPITPSSICLVRTPIQSPQPLTSANTNISESATGVKHVTNNSPTNNDKRSQVSVTFRQPIVPIQSSCSTTHSNMLQSNGPSNSHTDHTSVQVSRKRSHGSFGGNSKRRKTSVSNPPLPPAVVSKSTCESYVSPNRVTHSIAQECFEKLKIVDVKSLVSAPSLQPYNFVLPPCACDLTSALEKDDEESYILRKGVKYSRGPLAVGFPKCFDSSISSDAVDTYLIQHLRYTVPPGPMMHHRNNFANKFTESSICASPEPPSFENHIKALFSKMHKFSTKDNSELSYDNGTQYNSKFTSENSSPCSLLHMFSQTPPTCGKTDADRCTPPLALHHMPNPRLLCQPIKLISDLHSQSFSPNKKHSEDPVRNIKLEQSSVPVSNVTNTESCSRLPTPGPVIDSETGEVLLQRDVSLSSESQNSESTVTENDKLHITFTINPSTTISIPKIIRRITELLGVNEDSVGYQITRSGAQITLDQKQPQGEVDMLSLETHLRQQFTPLSLRLEKESTQRHPSVETQQDGSGVHHCMSPVLSNSPQCCVNNISSHIPKAEHSSPVFDVCKYPEEPISLISLLASKNRPNTTCKNCDKPVSPHIAQRKWLDELVNISGVTMRADVPQDFIFCSTDCLTGYSRFISSNRSKILDISSDYQSQTSDNVNIHNQNSDANRQLMTLDLPCSVPVLLQNSTKSRPNNLKRQFSMHPSGPPYKRRTAQTPSLLSKYKKWRGVRWRSHSSESNPLSSTIKRSSEEFNNISDNEFPLLQSRYVDERTCTLCSLKGDAAEDGPGRLLPLDLDRWIHVNCALWCYEVYETVGGSLNNVDLWLNKALSTVCSHCGNHGAGLPCYNPKCTFVYHVPCALEIGCMFFTDRGMYCPQHQIKEVHPMRLFTLAASRRIYISRDENNQVASVVHEEDRNHVVRIGGVCLHSIGQLLPHQIDSGYFHTRRNIYPVGLCTTRIYWSTRRPLCRASYVCEILERDCRPLFRITTSDEDMENETFIDETCNNVWQMVLSKIDTLRKEHKLVKLFPQHLRGEDLYGLSEPHIVRAIESLPGVDGLRDYVFNFGRLELISEMPLAINPSGCARSEPKMQSYVKRLRTDSSESTFPNTHRPGGLPGIRRLSHPSLSSSGHFLSDSLVSKQQQSSRSQQYRRLKTEVYSNVMLGRSRIQGFGLFAARDLEQQTMVIEYIGELIRLELANKREKEYEAHNRGIYMFRLDDDMVIDATVCGALARYINHSCEPNCYAECISFSDQSHIVIITNRRIKKGEELCYDYNFDLDDGGDRIPCLCGAPSCRKWMN